MTNYVYSIYLIQATRRVIFHQPSQSNFTHRNTKFASQEKATRACFWNQWSLNDRGLHYILGRGKGTKKLKNGAMRAPIQSLKSAAGITLHVCLQWQRAGSCHPGCTMRIYFPCFCNWKSALTDAALPSQCWRPGLTYQTSLPAFFPHCITQFWASVQIIAAYRCDSFAAEVMLLLRNSVLFNK